MTFFPLSVSLGNDLGDPIFDGVGLVGFKSRANAFLFALMLSPFLSPTVFPFYSLILWVGIVLLGSFFNNNNILIIEIGMECA